MQIRKAIVADQFYPAQYDSCVNQINECLDKTSSDATLPEKITGGIVPHAGWMFSGSLAAMAVSSPCSIARRFLTANVPSG